MHAPGWSRGVFFFDEAYSSLAPGELCGISARPPASTLL